MDLLDFLKKVVTSFDSLNIIKKKSLFDDTRFSRACRIEIEKIPVRFASAEDVIIKKLEYYRSGESDKHLRDIAGILKVSGESLDFAYLEKWVTTFRLASIWKKVKHLSPLR